MSATVASQGGRVQLEQSDLHLAGKMAKMDIAGVLQTAIEVTQYLNIKLLPQVQQHQTHRAVFSGHETVKTAIERHPTMLCQNHTNRCLPCYNGTAVNALTHWSSNGMCVPPQDQDSQPAPESTPSLPTMPPTPLHQASQTNHLQPGYLNLHTSLPSAPFFNLVSCAWDSQHDISYNPDMLTDKGTSTGSETVWCVEVQLTFILKARAAY